MANSGTFGGNGVSSRGNYCWVAWQLAGQENGNNRSLINWQFYAHFNNSDNQLDNGVVNSNVGQLYANGGRVKNYQGTLTTRDVAIASGSFWVGHGGDGRGFVQFGIGLDYYGDGRSQGTSGVWELPQIARQAYLTNLSQDINDLDDPWVEFANPGGYPVNVWLEVAGNRYFQNNSVGSRFTWSLSEADRNTLRALTPNSNVIGIRYVVETNINGSYYADYRDRNYTIVNANPTFTDYTYRDKNAATSAITGNDQYLIQGQSELELTISAANKATALKQATMTKYNAAISSVSQDIAYATTAIVQSLGVVGANADTPLVVNAIDSRGNQTGVTKTIKVLPYVVPQVTASAARLNNFETQTKIHIEGIISRLTVGSTDKNGVVAASGVQYRYKKTTDATWGAWTNVASTTTNGNVATTDFNVNLDRAYAWNIQVKIADKVSSTTVDLLLTVGIPIFRVSTYDNLVYNNEQPLMPSHIGMIIHSAALDTAAKVQALYGGTWAAWGVGKVLVGVDTTQTEFATVGQTGGDKNLQAHGHSLYLHNTGEEAGGYGLTNTSSFANRVFVTGGGGYRYDTTTSGTGSGQNLQPYQTAYMWKRTA